MLFKIILLSLLSASTFANADTFVNPFCMNFSGTYYFSKDQLENCSAHDYYLDDGKIGKAVSVPFLSSFHPIDEIIVRPDSSFRIEQVNCASLKITSLDPVIKNKNEELIHTFTLMEENRFEWTNQGLFIRTRLKYTEDYSKHGFERYDITMTLDHEGNLVIMDRSRIKDRFVRLFTREKFRANCIFKKVTN